MERRYAWEGFQLRMVAMVEPIDVYPIYNTEATVLSFYGIAAF
jgi:hypothetical protein